MTFHPNIRKIGLALLPGILLLVFLFTTNPQELPLVLLLVPFLLLLLSIFSAAYFSFALLSFKSLARRRRLVLSFCLALLPTALLLLQSINQLTARDSLLFSVFIFILVLYVARVNVLKR